MHFWSFYQKSLTTRPWPNLQMVHLWLERIVKMVHLCFVVAFLELSLLQLQMFQNTQNQFKSSSRDQNLSSKTLSRGGSHLLLENAPARNVWEGKRLNQLSKLPIFR